MTETIFALCAVMSVVCAGMLLLGYLQERSQMLLWSSVCFAMLALTNMILFVDVVMLPQIDFHGAIWRNLLSAVASTVLVFGLVWEIS